MNVSKKITIHTGVAIVLLSFMSCNNFLDTLPDNRTSLQTADQISKLLVSAYPTSNISLLAELSSDNFVDNNSPDVSVANNLASLERMHDEIYAWEEITSSEDDSPFTIWEECYNAIATANHALKAIDELEASGTSENLAPQRGEALLCRAYGHFILVNMFCQAYKDAEASRLDLGIPYVTEPETLVTVQYDRGTVTDVYEKIAADIEAGIPLLGDDSYSIPKYHFNTQAAHAFAARFYLYARNYEKVVYHAGKVLDNNPLSVLRDWTTIYDNSDEETYAYIKETESANLLILPTNSVFARIFYKTRYAFNGKAVRMISRGGPNWSGWPSFYSGGWWWTYGQEFGLFCSKVGELFEYTDKIAGIGYTHVVRTEFTTDETLLCRAEALLFLNRTDEALNDLNTWCVSHKINKPLTEQQILSFYTPERINVVSPLNSSKMSSSFIVTPGQEPFVQCILHFRRLETLFEGLRWFDVKRYGIEIEHLIGANKRDVLRWDDSRRAIQIPQDVLAAGMTRNPSYSAPSTNLTIQPAIRNSDE